jgi:DNA-binding response OmpR family regulator
MLRPHTILLFEDNPDIGGLVRELLTAEGYLVLEPRSLEEAQDLVVGGAASLVLADSGEATGTPRWARTGGTARA